MLKTKPAAEYVGVSPQYLEKLRVVGGGPEFLKFGRAVRYEKQALDSWIASRRRRSTSDLGLAA